MCIEVSLVYYDFKLLGEKIHFTVTQLTDNVDTIPAFCVYLFLKLVVCSFATMLLLLLLPDI